MSLLWYLKPKRKKNAFKMHTCPRCDYQFEVPTGEVILDRILSVPFSSVLFTPIILSINYFIAHWTYEGGILDFGMFVSFHILISISTLLFILYVSTRGSNQIFILNKRSSNNIIQNIKNISPLIKISAFLGIALIAIPFILHQRLF
ncbi:MAG: hypothetical protein KGD64_02345 [Candidatus Heimdallarchaeota archaeon]|nr:hypothetical protein [Candidatus Heimdallarchaeota archaeon]